MLRHKPVIIWVVILAVLVGFFTPVAPVYAASHQSSGDSGGNSIINILLGLLAGTLLNKVAPGLGDKLGVPDAKTSSGGKEVLGFYAEWWDTDTSSYTAMAKHTDTLNTVVPFWATLHADGSVSNRGGKDHAGVVSFAHKSNMTAHLMVNNAGESAIHTVLNDPGLRTEAIDNLEATVRKYQLDGINIDFESVPPGDRDNLTAFMRELSGRFKPQGYTVSIDVMPKTNESNDTATAYDYRQLASYADKIIIMAYDNHGQWSGAGPVAGIGWVEDNLKYALKFIPKSKLYLGLAGYGYDWSSKGVEEVESCAATSLAGRYGAVPEWDDDSESPYFHYTGDDGVTHTVWYENSQSTAYKLDLVNKYGIAGVALWKLGQEDPGDWQLFKDKLAKK